MEKEHHAPFLFHIDLNSSSIAMRVSRVWVAGQLSQGLFIDLCDDVAHYVRTVLRLKKGQELVLFNGMGGEYRSRIVEVSKKTVNVHVLEYRDRNVESGLTVSLGLAISRSDRMDWALQKAVELGANMITPLFSERCVIKLDQEKQQQRLRHWQKIVQHAAEQSGRTCLPVMHGCEKMKDWVAGRRGLKLFFDPHAQQTIFNLQPVNEGVMILSGPEGGFTAQEREYATAAGFVPVRLGARILRTETAVLAAMSAVQTLWGDFK